MKGLSFLNGIKLCVVISLILGTSFTVSFSQTTCTPTAPVCVPANGYAFQFASDTDFGLKFNTSTQEYHFTDGNGVGLVKIHAVNGNVVIDNKLLVNGRVGFGAGNPLAVDFSVNNGISQFGVLAGYGQFDNDGDLSFSGTANFLVGPNKYAFRYSGDEDFGLYFSLSDFAYDFLGLGGNSLFRVGSLTGDISNSGTATIGVIPQNDNLDLILTADSNGLIHYRDASTLGGGPGGGVGVNTIDKVPKWNGSNLVTGTISMTNTSASGSFASAIGNTTQAPGQSAFASGASTVASGPSSFASGLFSVASGISATALGTGSIAFGDNSIASGDNSAANGYSSLAFGRSAMTTGDLSIALGEFTTARSYSETVLGSFNQDYTPVSDSSWVSADRLFVIGNGTPGNNSNALTIIKSGYIGIGTNIPETKLHMASGYLRVAGVSTSDAGIELQPRIAGVNGGGRIFFRQSDSDNWGVSLGYTGGANGVLNWPAKSFNISLHSGDPIGTIALSIDRVTGNIGIGTSEPTTDFDIDGNIRVRGLSSSGIRPLFADSTGLFITNTELELGAQSNSPGLSIPDNSCVGFTDVINLGGLPSSISSSTIRVTVDILHTFVADLSIFLVSPSSDTLCLLQANGGSGDNLSNTVFSDDGILLGSSSTPYSGLHQPNGNTVTICGTTGDIGSFGEFGGGTIDPNGIWRIIIYDQAGLDSGTLNYWEVSIVESSILGDNNFLPKWFDGELTRNSSIYDNGNVGVGTLTPTAKLEAVVATSTVDAAVKGTGVFGPTNGYLGVQGTDDFDGVTSLDLPGLEIGVLGVSSGTSTLDNYGVVGHASSWGGSFQNSLTGSTVSLGGTSRSINALGDVLVRSITLGDAKPVITIKKENCGLFCGQPEPTQGLHLQNVNQSSNRMGIGFGDADQELNPSAWMGAFLYDKINHYADLEFQTKDADGLSVKMTIKGNGDIGIGSSSPNTKLDVDGDITSRSLSGIDARPVFADSEGKLITQDLTEILNETGSMGDPILVGDSCIVYSDTIFISGATTSASAADIRVAVDLAAAPFGLFQVLLKAPTGDVICLYSSSSSSTLSNAVFYDGGIPSSELIPPLSGLVQPSGCIYPSYLCGVIPSVSTFSQLGGGTIDVNGEWILMIYNDFSFGSGSINNWSVSVLEGEQLGIDNYVPKWTAGSLSNYSSIYDNGNVGIGTADPGAKLDVSGDALINGLRVGRGNGDNISNTALGYQALESAGGFLNDNTAIGFLSMIQTTGGTNTAVGGYSLSDNTTGYSNTACGFFALGNNTIGQSNAAFGHGCLTSNISGNQNTAAGRFALNSNSGGSNNSAFGYSANSTGNFTNTTALGYDVDPTADNTVRVGNSSITSIGGQVAWSNLSDKRFKTNVSNKDVVGLDFINKLNPVVYNFDLDAFYNWKSENYGEVDSSNYSQKYDIEGIRFSGFLAQEVEAAANEANYNFSGVDKPKNEKDFYGLRYGEFVVPLVKAVQEQQEQIEESNDLGTQNAEAIEELADLISEFNETTEQHEILINNMALKIKTQDDLISELLQRLVITEESLDECCTLHDSYEDHLNNISDKASLGQNIPNPFEESTIIPYYVPENFGDAFIVVSELNGKQIARYDIKEAGLGKISFNSGSLASSTYIYSLFVNGEMVDSKLMVLK